MDRVKRDYGMLATVINGMAARCLRRQRDAYPFTNCIKIEAIAEPYIKRRAVRHLEEG
jgi:uridylate kinase